jgi:hypothetical protein
VDDIPHTTATLRQQHRFSINVPVINLSDHFLGPVVLPNTPTSAVCHPLSVNDLAVLLEHVPLHQRQHMWFMRD